MKKSKIIIPALAMLLISTAACVTGTVAWFSANKIATVDGMKIKASTDSDMLIGKMGSVATSNAIDVDSTNFKTALSFSDDAVELAAASSIDAKTFYKANGTINGAGAVEGDTKYAVATNPNTGAQYYKQWDFVVKYANASESDQDVDLTKLTLTYAGDVDPSTAWRIGVLTQSCYTTYTNNVPNTSTIGEDEDGDPTSIDCKGVYAPTAAVNFTEGKAVSGVNAVNTVTAVADHVYSCDAGTTTFFKLSIVAWLEGEDKTCRSDVFLDLNQDWALDFEIAKSGTTGHDAVENLEMAVTD